MWEKKGRECEPRYGEAGVLGSGKKKEGLQFSFFYHNIAEVINTKAMPTITYKEVSYSL